MSRNECRVYVGNLPPDIRTKDIEDLFYRYGKILYVDLKNRRGPPFAFVEFEDPSGSWQDLKDHMREAGDVCFADVYKDGSGVVEFLRYEDMKYAVKKLDDSRFRSHEGETSYIRVKEDYGGSADRRSRSRSYSPARRRGSPSYSPNRSASRSRSRSRSRSYERR
ncbi:Serine/arginine-rich splicing factor 9 [Orchesella cincta]|uniref:Serine/arginine-rich splicing factor 9 n=1 Tax=Orchesella cincta TaxID=48709 RepID=A0A1D2N823_ORCCI|nr:Serine/arginine-rich splicing factor 9 [Orchesella cincta]